MAPGQAIVWPAPLAATPSGWRRGPGLVPASACRSGAAQVPDTFAHQAQPVKSAMRGPFQFPDLLVEIGETESGESVVNIWMTTNRACDMLLKMIL